MERDALAPDPVADWVQRLIEDGTGLRLPPDLEVDPDPLRSFEARLASWRQAEPLITGVDSAVSEDDEPRVLTLPRFGYLRLVDLSVAGHRERWTVKVTLKSKQWSPREDFLLLHGQIATREDEHAQHRPNRGDVVRVLSALDWYLTAEAPGRSFHNVLAGLVASVYPPLFVLISRKDRAPQALVSEAISNWRKRQQGEDRQESAESDRDWLMKEMAATRPPVGG